MKKGFTIVEVITVIGIIALIITIAVPTYFGVVEQIKKNNYDNKIKLIEADALKWAEDNNITDKTVITIAKLIDDGYVEMDDEESTDKRVINPINNESMECYHVIISVDGGNYTSEVVESDDCELLNIEEYEQNILIEAYPFDKDSNKVLSSTPIRLLNNRFDWTKYDVLLVTNSDVYDNPKSISFNSGGNNNKKVGENYVGNIKVDEVIDVDNYKNLFVVSANVLLSAKYEVLYELELESAFRNVYVNIDKENPSGNFNIDNKWSSGGTKEVELIGYDGVGSGVKGFYVSKDNKDIGDNFINAKDDKASISLEEDLYYVWVVDNVGNLSDSPTFEINVNNSDNNPPECVYPAGNNTWTNEPVTITWGCRDSESGCVTNNQSKTFNTGTITSYTIPQFTIKDGVGNTTVCEAKTISIKFDAINPTCSITSNSRKSSSGWYIENANVVMTTSDVGSGVINKGLTTGLLQYNGITSVVQRDTKFTTYNGYVKDAAGNTNTCSFSLKVDTTAPIISGGKIYDGYFTPSTATDVTSGIDKIYYYYSKNNTKPTVNSSGWSASTTYSATCETTYYGFAVAKDKAGNYSNVIPLGSVRTKACCTVKTGRCYSPGAVDTCNGVTRYCRMTSSGCSGGYWSGSGGSGGSNLIFRESIRCGDGGWGNNWNYNSGGAACPGCPGGYISNYSSLHGNTLDNYASTSMVNNGTAICHCNEWANYAWQP